MPPAESEVHGAEMKTQIHHSLNLRDFFSALLNNSGFFIKLKKTAHGNVPGRPIFLFTFIKDVC